MTEGNNRDYEFTRFLQPGTSYGFIGYEVQDAGKQVAQETQAIYPGSMQQTFLFTERRRELYGGFNKKGWRWPNQVGL
jgi:hypothetical protein